MRHLALIALLFIGISLNAAVLRISADHKVFYQQSSPGAKNQVLVFNGLIYPMKYWDKFAAATKKKHNLIQYAYSAHPESLKHLSTAPFYESSQPFWGFPGERGFSIEDLADEAKSVLDELNIKKPIVVMSLSYGSFAAVEFAKKYPKLVKHLVLVAPAVKPSQAYEPMMNMTGFNNYFSTGQLYPLVDYQYRSWLHTSIKTLMTQKYQALGNKYLPPGLGFNRFFKSVFHLARAARYKDLTKEVSQIKRKMPVTLWLAGKEEKPLLADQLNVLAELDKNKSTRTSAILFEDAFHAMPGAYPAESAIIFNDLLKNHQNKSKTRVRASGGKLSYQPW